MAADWFVQEDVVRIHC